MNKIKFFLYNLFIIAIVFGVSINVSNDFTAKTAEAQYACGSIEVIAGDAGSISGTMTGPFSGACKQGTIYSIPGVDFDSQYVGQNWCSNGWSVTEYATQNYDARNFPTGISLPATYYTTVEAYFDTGGECELAQASIEVTVISGGPPAPSFTCTVNQNTATVDAGSSTAYTISTTPANGFNSPVTFTASVSPTGTSTPTVSFSGNGQAPSAVTTANVSTAYDTSVNTYTITFTGDGGGTSANCNTQLVVNPAQGDFELVIQPSTGILPNTNPNRVNIGTNAVFTVFAECTGGFNGTISNMSATTTFTGPSVSLGATSLACGATTTVTVTNTGSVPGSQQSTINNITSESVAVTGSAQL